MTYAVVRVRGTLKVKPEIKETLRLLRLNRVNHCVIIPENDCYRGMLQKAKDYITWGELDEETAAMLIKGRARMKGDIPLKPAHIKKATPFKNAEEMGKAIAEGSMNLKELEGMEPVFRLSPPTKGGFEGVKRSHAVGGALGYRGQDINGLLKRMI